MADDNLTNDSERGESAALSARAPPGMNGSRSGTSFGGDDAIDLEPTSVDPASQARSDVSHPSTATLLRQLGGDAARLFRKEIALAASEVTESFDRAKTGAISLVSAGAVLYAGVLFLLGGATLALALIVPTWAAWLIVGAATTVVGSMMVQTGKRRLSASSFAPSRTADALRKDSAAIRRQVS